MKCPQCSKQIAFDAVSHPSCGWNVRPTAERPPVKIETPPASPERARAALRDIGRMTGRHLARTWTEERILANWREARERACNKVVYDMCEEAIARLERRAPEPERVPGSDDY